MFKHYLASALRHFARHKTTTIINVLSLAIGLACFACAYGWTEYLSHGDLYNENASRTYVVTQANEFGDRSSFISSLPLSGWDIATYVKQSHPSLEIARAMVGQEIAVATKDAKNFALVSYADPEFLRIFDLNFVGGNRRAALESPRSAIITEDFAKQLFGSSDVLGKSVLLNNRETVYITGVIGAQRQPSHINSNSLLPFLRFSLMVSMDTEEAMLAATSSDTPHAGNRFFLQTSLTYIAFPKSADPTLEQVRNELSQFSERHVPAEQGRLLLDLRPASQINASIGDTIFQRDKTGISNNAFFMLLGSALLAAACLNYANVASAQATTRLKELALRRVVGASHRQILAQSFFEALVLVSAAGCLALSILPSIIAVVRRSTGFDIGPVIFESMGFWIWMVATLVVVAMLACCYPAWVAARIRPAQALQSGQAPLTKRRLMSFLVICQFASASFLIVFAIVVNAQNEKLRPLPHNAFSDPIVVINNKLKDAGLDIQLLQNELRRQPTIQSVSAIDVAPGDQAGVTRAIVLKNAEPSSRHWVILAPVVDHEYFSTMGSTLLAGRVFDRGNAADVASAYGKGNVVIDRALAAEYGWPNPQDAIGKPIYVPSSSAKNAVGIPRTVIGVVENEKLVLMSMQSSTSTVYSLDPTRAAALVVRISKMDVAGGVSAIDRVWNQLAPNIPLKRAFLDERFDATYKLLTTLTVLYPALALVSLLVGSMGLIGIATHAMTQRRFEIGVRRTMGASTYQVLTMLLKDFAKPILIANLLAWPFAFVVAKAYGNMFSDRAPLTIMPFAASLMLGLAIAWLAVLKQAAHAARMNPATVLRHE